jgi:hypothetical protein
MIHFENQPSYLVPFSVRLGQQYEYDFECNETPGARLKPHIKYVEVFTYDNSFKMLRYDKYEKNMFLNVYGISVALPYYYGNDIKVDEDFYRSGEGGLMRFNTSYGLSVVWDGEKTIGISMSSSYGGFVCGLCGNADSNNFNIFLFKI